MPVYNKLVRDRILEVLEREKLTYSSKILNPSEFAKSVQKKLYEEVKEFEQANSREEITGELADILELVYAAAEMNQISLEELESVRLDKKIKRGGFEKRIFLLEVNDE
ncbi:MAG: nucleoside triphosphate pyrophosphohydrolase [Kurthia sp.]|nr:nucleoside triphosphate pyrophosphohydrolase [Candidatus Kurthia equi]